MAAHSKSARDHDEARNAVCILCFKKAVKNARKISEKYENKIITNVPDFQLINDKYPSMFCVTCRVNLEKNKPIKSPIHYANMNIEKSQATPCTCDLCTVGKSNQHMYHKVLNIPKLINGRPKSHLSKKKRLSICSKCLSELQKGKPHVCTIRSKKKKRRSSIRTP